MNKTILDLIGATPVVRINKLIGNPQVEIYAKLEGQNPGGSIKDRIALSMIEDAEKKGDLTHEKAILEPTSGNTGIGLALIAAVKGYDVFLTMSSGMSKERKILLRALGAILIETDPEKGTDGAIEKAHEIYRKNPKKYWMPNQFSNYNNPLAHYQGTANEIIRQIPDLTTFVAGMGTTGTLMGVSKRLKESSSRIEIIGVEPEFRIQGLKNLDIELVPKIWDPDKIDEKITVTEEQASDFARKLAIKEGILVGLSSGAAMYAAYKKSIKMKKGKLAVIFPDRGEKYLSTNLYGKMTK